MPSMKHLFPNTQRILQQHNAPCHTSKKVKKWFEENNVEVIPWPGNSPDLNPMHRKGVGLCREKKSGQTFSQYRRII